MSIPGIFTLFLMSIAPIVGIVMAIRLTGWRLKKRPKLPDPGPRCKCGYPLDGLGAARCPECGRVFNFDATAEELGLTQEQLERAQRKAQERAARN